MSDNLREPILTKDGVRIFGELGIVAAYAGHFGVPTIFVAGDRAATGPQTFSLPIKQGIRSLGEAIDRTGDWSDGLRGTARKRWPYFSPFDDLRWSCPPADNC